MAIAATVRRRCRRTASRSACPDAIIVCDARGMRRAQRGQNALRCSPRPLVPARLRRADRRRRRDQFAQGRGRPVDCDLRCRFGRALRLDGSPDGGCRPNHRRRRGRAAAGFARELGATHTINRRAAAGRRRAAHYRPRCRFQLRDDADMRLLRQATDVLAAARASAVSSVAFRPAPR